MGGQSICDKGRKLTARPQGSIYFLPGHKRWFVLFFFIVYCNNLLIIAITYYAYFMCQATCKTFEFIKSLNNETGPIILPI